MRTALALESSSVDFGSPDRVEHHLLNWARWQRTGEVVQGFPSQTPGTVNWTIRSDFDAMVERCDQISAVAMDTIINEELPAPEACAVMHRYLAAVFRFPRVNYTRLLEQAKASIGIALSRRGIY